VNHSLSTYLPVGRQARVQVHDTKGNKKMKRKGFTLIELLVVIAIIGLLSTLAVVSLNSARGKARDAQRVSDIKQISTALEIFNASEDTYVACSDTIPAEGLLFSACTEVAGFDITDVSIFTDPNGTGLCTESSTSCNYSIASMTSTAYEICFALEDGSGNLNAEIASISTGGILANSCSL